MSCPICGAEHKPASGGRTACPYQGLPYADLRAGHDQLYFGRWRTQDATPGDVRRAQRRLEAHLRRIDRTLKPLDLPAARRDLNKAFEAFHTMDPGEDGPQALTFLDHALSYAHRVIDDLLHERGLPPHYPMDFAGWYDAGNIPFREDW